jgi:hypothetical protein
MKKFKQIILLTLLIIFQTGILSAQKADIHKQNDSLKTYKKLTKFLNFKASSFGISFRTLPNTALNYTRFTVVSNHNKNLLQYEFNSNIQLFFDDFTDKEDYPDIRSQYDALFNNIQLDKSKLINNELINNINELAKKEIFLSIWRTNLMHVKTEQDIIKNVTKTTGQMIHEGFDNLSENLLPFITMLMLEQEKHHYQKERVVSTRPESKGIVTAVQMLNAMSSLNDNVNAGVCRDIHDMGLRILRPMYRVYLDEKYPDNDYNVDDYIFLQAWVTPSSQHITLVVLEPENTRNYHELDWGKVIKKENQEGIAVGKMVGTTVRLWQYNPKKNVTGAFNMVKSQWGIFLDSKIFKNDESWLINGIYNPQYASSADYTLNAGKKSELGISLGMLNSNERLLSFSYRSNAHQTDIAKILEYDGTVAIQTMIIDDTQRKSYTMPWNEWYSVVNLINSVRYLSKLKTKSLTILPGLTANLFAQSQLEVFLSLSHFKSNNENFNNKMQGSGDGNIWLTWGAELNYKRPQFSFDYIFGSRNFLIPTDVRLLSPNPFELIRHATIANSGMGVLTRIKYSNTGWDIEPEFRYEQNKMNAQFILYSLKLSKKIKNKSTFFAKAGSFNQIQGLEYYWYAKTRFWFDLGFESRKKQFNISLHFEAIQNDFLTFGLSFNKSLN